MFLYSECDNHFPVLNLKLTRITILIENRIFQRGKNLNNYSEIKIDPKTENLTDDTILYSYPLESIKMKGQAMLFTVNY